MNYLVEIPRDVLYIVVSYLDTENLNVFKVSKLVPIEEFDSEIFWGVYFRYNGIPLISKSETYFQWILEYIAARDSVQKTKYTLENFLKKEDEYFELIYLSTGRPQDLLIIDDYLNDDLRSFFINGLGYTKYLCLKKNFLEGESLELVIKNRDSVFLLTGDENEIKSILFSYFLKRKEKYKI